MGGGTSVTGSRCAPSSSAADLRPNNWSRRSRPPPTPISPAQDESRRAAAILQRGEGRSFAGGPVSTPREP